MVKIINNKYFLELWETLDTKRYFFMKREKVLIK